MFRYLCNMEQMLREMIEKMVGRKMVVPRDFAWLSEKVEEHTQQRVSASTLRRFWGYVSEVARHNHLAPHHLFYHFT